MPVSSLLYVFAPLLVFVEAELADFFFDFAHYGPLLLRNGFDSFLHG